MIIDDAMTNAEDNVEDEAVQAEMQTPAGAQTEEETAYRVISAGVEEDGEFIVSIESRRRPQRTVSEEEEREEQRSRYLSYLDSYIDVVYEENFRGMESADPVEIKARLGSIGYSLLQNTGASIEDIVEQIDTVASVSAILDDKAEKFLKLADKMYSIDGWIPTQGNHIKELRRFVTQSKNYLSMPRIAERVFGYAIESQTMPAPDTRAHNYGLETIASEAVRAKMWREQVAAGDVYDEDAADSIVEEMGLVREGF